MEFQSRNVLLTGGAGYIGSVVACRLLEQGLSVHILDNLSRGSDANLPTGAVFHKMDVGDTVALRRLFQLQKFQAVFHFAGFTRVDESISNPDLYFSENYQKPLGLIDVCKEFKVTKFVFSSTAAVYGEVKEIVRHDHPTNPINPYGKSKLLFEQALKDKAGADFHVLILRYFNVVGVAAGLPVGPRDLLPANLFRRAAMVSLGLQKTFTINGSDFPTADGTAIRDFIHVDDLANAHVLGLKYLETSEQLWSIFNLGNGRGYSVQEVIDGFLALGTFDIQRGPRRPGDPASVIAESKMAQEHLFWKPQFYDLGYMIESTLAWERFLRFGKGSS